MLGNLWFTVCLPLIIIIDEEGNVNNKIDGVHDSPACGKVHSSLFVTVGTNDMINVSKKLGVGAIISTETEVVSTRERFHKCTWFR